VPLRRYLRSHEVTTAYELGWSTLQNGFLISQAEAAGFDVLITTDKNWKYQQNLSKRSLAIVVRGIRLGPSRFASTLPHPRRPPSPALRPEEQQAVNATRRSDVSR